ncbi:MAG: hypothetical protein M0P58_08940 [Bacteroidales bacterium]|nr:hypothetical protein [Bacteroidales bacterium]
MSRLKRLKNLDKQCENHWKRWEIIGEAGRMGAAGRTIGEDGRMIGGPLEEMGERLEDHWSLIGL